MNKLSYCVLPAIALAIAGCQTTNAVPDPAPTPVASSASAGAGAQFDVNAVLKAGMTKDEVLAVLGQPNTRNDSLNNSLWTYDQLVSGETTTQAPAQTTPQTNQTGNAGNVANGVGTIVGGNAGRILRGLGQIARSTPRRTTQTTPPPATPSTAQTVLRPKIDVYFDAQGLLTDYQSVLTQ